MMIHNSPFTRLGTLAHFVVKLLPLAVLGCAHATPVTPAPLAANDSATLAAMLTGTCTVTATQQEGDEPKHTEGLHWTFGSDGQASYRVGSVVSRFAYRVDGRNIVMDGPYKTIRIDDWSTPTMKWFMYDLSQTYYCTKQ
jgi:hypothetical protein